LVKINFRSLLVFTTCMLLAPTATAEISFSVSGVSVPGTIKHEIQPLFTQPEGLAELLVRRVEKSGDRILETYPISDEKKIADQAKEKLIVDDDVIFMDVGKVSADSRESVVFFRRDSAYRIDLETGNKNQLIEFQSLYQRPVLSELPSLDFVYDINGDELDDIVIPDFDGYRVFLQKVPGQFEPGVLIAAPAIMEVGWQDYPWYRRANLYRADINLDGSIDLLYWDEDQLQIYFQNSNKKFNIEAVPYTPSVEFHNEGLAGITFRMGNGNDQSDIEEKSLFKMTDLDNDDLVDLVTLTVNSKGVFNKTSTYEIYMGTRDEEGRLAYAQKPDSLIHSDGVQFQMKEVDFRNDGHTDLVVSAIEIGLGKILAALITGSISQDLEFYEMGDSGYSKKPRVVREVTTTFDLGSGDVFYPTILIIDVNGDQIVDLIVQDGSEAVKIYEGIDSPKLFARSYLTLDVDMPDNPDYVTVGDLNRDGKKDIMIRYGEGEDAAENRIKVLIAK